MLSSAFDLAGDLVNHLVWLVYALQGGNFLQNIGF